MMQPADTIPADHRRVRMNARTVAASKAVNATCQFERIHRKAVGKVQRSVRLGAIVDPDKPLLRYEASGIAAEIVVEVRFTLERLYVTGKGRNLVDAVRLHVAFNPAIADHRA